MSHSGHIYIKATFDKSEGLRHNQKKTKIEKDLQRMGLLYSWNTEIIRNPELKINLEEDIQGLSVHYRNEKQHIDVFDYIDKCDWGDVVINAPDGYDSEFKIATERMKL